jgi:hypothetical protein
LRSSLEGGEETKIIEPWQRTKLKNLKLLKRGPKPEKEQARNSLFQQ